jgi:hypothetical protein
MFVWSSSGAGASAVSVPPSAVGSPQGSPAEPPGAAETVPASATALGGWPESELPESESVK